MQNRSHHVQAYNNEGPDFVGEAAFTRQLLSIPPPGTLFTYAQLGTVPHQWWGTVLERPPIPEIYIWPSEQDLGAHRVVVTDAWSYARRTDGVSMPPLTEKISEGLASSILNGAAGLGTFGFVRHQSTAAFLSAQYSCPNYFASTDFSVPFAADTLYLVFRLNLPFAFNRVFTAEEISSFPHQWILISEEVFI